MRGGKLLLTMLLVITKVIAQVPLFPDSAGLRVSKVNCNSHYAEFSPFVFNNDLYFVSDRPYNYGIVNYQEETHLGFTDLYICNKRDSCRFTKAKNLKHPLNSPMNDGPFCITSRGIYITTNNTNARLKSNRTLPLQISFSDRNSDDKYARPKRINFGVSDTISFGHPCVIGDTLMFLVSDEPGGFGGTDLYYSRYINGTWQTPLNCGDRINTAYNEEFPSFSNQKLFFSSDRPGGFGKLDIYCAEQKQGLFLPAAIVCNPVNSKGDDFGIFFNKEKNSGYFSSDRYGNDDIYYYSMDAALDFSNCQEVKFTPYCYSFFEENAKTSTDTVGLYYEWDFGDGKKAKGAEVVHCYTSEGKYTVALNVIDRSTGDIFFNELSYELEIKNPEQLFIDMPDSVKAGAEIRFDPSFSYISGYEIKKYSWNFGDEHFAFEEKPIHRYEHPGMYPISLKTSGLLYGKAEDRCVTRMLRVLPPAFSGYLSASRKLPLSKRTEDILTKRIIDSLFRADPDLYNFIRDKIRQAESRDSARANSGIKTQIAGADSTTLLFKNAGTDTSSNYRVHIATSEKTLSTDDPFFLGLDSISEVKTRKLYQYFYGKFNSPSKALSAVKRLKELGFSPFVFEFNGDSLEYSMNPKLNEVLFAPDSLSKYTERDSLVEIVYFEFNDYKLNDKDTKTISALAKKYQKVGKEFLLSGYTDYTGTSDYNLKLCKKRLEAVNFVLKTNGVNNGKIKVKPIGAVKGGTADDESTRRHNRRVEVHVKLKQ